MCILIQKLDKNGLVIDVNECWEKKLEYEKNEVTGKHYKSYISNNPWSDFELQFQHLKEYGYVDNVVTFLTKKDGSIVEGILNAMVDYNLEGKMLHAVCEIRTLDFYISSVIETQHRRENLCNKEF